MKKFLGNAAAIIYLITMILPFALILSLIPIVLFTDLNMITKSGFSGQNTGFTLLGAFGFVFGIPMLIPALRKIYKKLPWLYVYVQVFMVDALVLSIGVYLLNIGFEVQNPVRHMIFFCLMVTSIVIGRLAMCFYYKKKPIKIVKE